MLTRTQSRILNVFLFCYSLSLLSSMSGMEVFGWLSGFAAAIFLWLNRPQKTLWPYFSLGPDYFLLGLWCISTLSFLVNLGYLPFGAAFGGMRWILFFYLLSYAWYLNLPSGKMNQIFLIIISIIALYAISQFFYGIDLIRHSDRAVHKFGNYFRSFGLLSSPMTFGNSILLVLFFPLSLWLLPSNSESKWFRWLSGITTVLVMLCLFTSQTRGAWIGAFFGILAVTYLLYRKNVLKIFVSLVVLIGLLYITISPLRDRINASLDFSRHDNLQRIHIWKMNWQMFLDHPILGVGHGRNVQMLPEYYQRNSIVSDFISEAHNTALQWLSGTGIIGFICFYGFVFFMIWLTYSIWKKTSLDINKRRWLLAAFGAQFAFIFSGLTECNFEDAEVKHVYLAYVAIIAAIAAIEKYSKMAKSSD